MQDRIWQIWFWKRKNYRFNTLRKSLQTTSASPCRRYR
nr:MAG TPA: hypothetical protein [Caudoviricetes sp.]